MDGDSAGLPVLDAAEQRILGALLEKQVTVPASYPLSLNALQTACNQATSRDPVTDYATNDIESVCRALKDRSLVRFVWAGTGARVVKFHQRLEEALGLAPDERALITLLLLRGAQAPGELKTRAERLHSFADRGEVEAVLTRLADRPAPLVRELPRRPGQHDSRWIHLLGPVATGDTPGPAEPTVDRNAVLGDGPSARDNRVRAAYDACAQAYAEGTARDLRDQPFDRWLLERIAAAADGPVVDIGSGPGHVAAHLADCGAEVSGVDLSTAMVAVARARYPQIGFDVGDFSRLLRPPHASAWGAVTAWYAFVHLAESELADTLAGLARIIAPDGVIAFAVHIGAEIRHEREVFGVPVDLDVVLHDRHVALEATRQAGLTDIESYLRSPMPGEVPTDRLYVLARPGTDRGNA